MDLRLNCISPFDPDKPHIPQQRLLDADIDGPEINKLHFVAGRGSGKTLGSVLLGVRACIEEPGTVGLVLSPTYSTLHDVFLATWRDIVPDELYTYKAGEKVIEFVNGSRILLKSRHINNPQRGRDAAKGLNVNWVIDDEAAMGFDKRLFNNVLGCIRRQGKIRFYACCTTPVLNEYHDVATAEGHTLIRCSSRDNPHTDEAYVEDLLAEMSAQEADREIEGRWVALEGLVWSTWDNGKEGGKIVRRWPAGNVHSHTFDPRLPYYLFVDLGVGNGAYVVVQRLEAELLGRRIFPGSVWVAVAELMPAHDGSASRAFTIIEQHFGRPLAVISGADIDTRASTDANTARYFATKIFGASVPCRPIAGWMADKQIQYDQMAYGIMSAAGERRFCVSEHMVQLDPDSRRGINELVVQDTWPENAGKVRGVYLNKDGRLEHVRDALLYGAVGQMWPPSFNKTARIPG